MSGNPETEAMPCNEGLRQHIIAMVRLIGYIIVPAPLFDMAREALPEIADKIIKSERLPTK